MQHEEQDPRHPHHWEQRHRREQEQYRHRYPDDHFNDFGSRWGEPAPPLNLHQHEWGPREVGRFREEGRYHQEEWRPDEHRYRQHRAPMGEHRPHPDEPMWRQRDIHFDPSNQRVEDRWSEDPTMPHPRQRPPRHYDGFWQDYED